MAEGRNRSSHTILITADPPVGKSANPINSFYQVPDPWPSTGHCAGQWSPSETRIEPVLWQFELSRFVS
jgi:hypothetical protein